MYKYIYRISKLLVILLVTLSSLALIASLMAGTRAQELESEFISTSSEKAVTDSPLPASNDSNGERLANQAALALPAADGEGILTPSP